MSNAPALDLSAIPIVQRAAVQALLEEVAALKDITKRQEHLIAELNHALHGKRSEKLTEDERQLAFEDLSIALAEVEAEKEKRATKAGDGASTKPAPKRTIGNLPAALPRIEEIIEPASLICPCGCGLMHKIGEDRSERLDIVPAQLRVIVTVRPKYACRICTDGVTQAPARIHLIMGGLPTEATLAHVLVSKYADHLPLYRQSQILARAGLDLHRAVLAMWVGKAAFHLKSVVDRLAEHLKRSGKLFMDETSAPVLDPGRGATKTGYLWALARDDRAWGGEDPPGVVYFYAPDRAGVNAETFLTGFDGILQIDGYTGYNRLTHPSRKGGAPIRVAHCWAHARRKLKEIFDRDGSEIAAEGLRRIAEFYAVEADIHGISPGQRLSARQTRTAPLVVAFGDWLQAQRRKISGKSRLGEKLAYIHNHWDGLQTFLHDGRVEIDSNRVENLIRPIALNRKNALFAGHDEGGIAWGRIASLIETCKINGVEPFAYSPHRVRRSSSRLLGVRHRITSPEMYLSRLGASEARRLWRQRCLLADDWRQPRLASEYGAILLPSDLAATRLAANPLDDRIGAYMITKPYDLTDAVTYHLGAFPPSTLDYEVLLGPLEEAAASLARYDAKMSGMVNSELFLAPLRRQDAVTSSRMEGTISTIEELYRLEAEEDAGSADPYREARNDDVETFLYSRALKNAQQALAEGAPLGEHLIRTAHQQLLSFGRGARKRPGSYKVEQNYIGDERRGKIHYAPIAPEQLGPAMVELVRYINESTMRPLIRTAIAHVEFEALHPFEDGNGRIGRMLITLMLWKLGVLHQPNFFVSGYFESHKDEYIGRMRAVSATGDWTGWVAFFLEAMHAQATVNIETADAIFSLHGEMRERFREVLNSQFHDQALDFVFASPIFRNDRFVERSGIPASSARALSRRLVDAGLLRTIEPASGRRAAMYAFDPLLDLLKV